jgi:hypothetical protein
LHTIAHVRYARPRAPEPVEPIDVLDAMALDDDAWDDPATALLAYLSSTSPGRMPPPARRSGRLVSLIVERDGS